MIDARTIELCAGNRLGDLRSRFEGDAIAVLAEMMGMVVAQDGIPGNEGAMMDRLVGLAWVAFARARQAQRASEAT